MMRASVAGGFITALVTLISAQPSSAGEFKFSDGDRVVLLGNTLIEREQSYGYWETMLTRSNPDKNITFRNLGWSGDTVWGEARAGFGTAEDGFRRLKEHVFALKPTVIIVAYGGNESFAGKAGLPRFIQGLNALLDVLAQTKARIVMLSPLRHARLPAPLPDPAEHNMNIKLYRDAMRRAADNRGHFFIDLLERFPNMDVNSLTTFRTYMTDNGVHLTAFGYWWSTPELAHGLGLEAVHSKIELNADAKVLAVEGAKVRNIKAAPLAFEVTLGSLPDPPQPKVNDESPFIWLDIFKLIIRGLAPGRYVLKRDGQALATDNELSWADGLLLLTSQADMERIEQLRKTIIKKNLLYFHRWRPQNDTYLFGFRKHEQGNNAVEIPQFDPLITQLEAEIAKLRVPIAHKYELVPKRGANK